MPIKIARQGVRAYLQTLADIAVIAEAENGATRLLLPSNKTRPMSS